MDTPSQTNSFFLVFAGMPSLDNTIRYCVGEGDMDDAIAAGLVTHADSIEDQVAAAARLKVITKRVCRDIRLLSTPWVILRKGRIIGSSSALVHPHRRLAG